MIIFNLSLYQRVENLVQEIDDQGRRIPDSIWAFFQPKISAYIEQAKFTTDYAKREMNKTLNWILGEIRLSLESEDFDSAIEGKNLFQKGWTATQNQAYARRLFSHAVALDLSTALAFVDTDFGYGEVEREKPRSEGMAIAQALTEPFERARDDFFQAMGQDIRNSDYQKSKVLARRFVTDASNYIASKIPEFR